MLPGAPEDELTGAPLGGVDAVAAAVVTDAGPAGDDATGAAEFAEHPVSASAPQASAAAVLCSGEATLAMPASFTWGAARGEQAVVA